MAGSLALKDGLLVVGREAKTAHVRGFDLDGHERWSGFSFRDARLGRSVAAGLAVDEDRRLWVADTPASRVRRFLVFGREVGGLGLGLQEPVAAPPWPDVRGLVRGPVDVAVRGNGEDGLLVVAQSGERRHAVQVFHVPGGYELSPRPMGDPHGRYRDVRGVALGGRFLYVAEAGAGRVQVFRDGSFHFAFSIPCAGGGRFQPVAVRPLDDGRMVVAAAGGGTAAHAVLLVAPDGRLERVLATSGAREGCVQHPADVEVERGRADAETRVAVVDQDGERVQIFTLEGRCYGAFGMRA